MKIIHLVSLTNLLLPSRFSIAIYYHSSCRCKQKSAFSNLFQYILRIILSCLYSYDVNMLMF